MTRTYASLSVRGQVSRLKPLALEACHRFGLPNPTLRLLNHAFNTTFAVSCGANRYALRLNVNSIRTHGEISAEIAWTTELAARTDIWVPRPFPTESGQPFLEIAWPELNRPMYAALYSWLPGKVGANNPVPFVAEGLGKATATLHEHARSWTMPAECKLTPLSNILFGKSIRAIERGCCKDPGVLREVETRANGVLQRLASDSRNPIIPIHSDLHLGNVKVHGRKVSVFDFDDSMMGWPLVDVAVSLFYLRRNPNAEELEAAYWQGLGIKQEALSSHEDREALTAGRALMLSNEIFDMNTADLIALAPKYAEVTELRLRHYLNTGRLDPNVASTQ